MVTLAQRIEALRMEKNISRPALAAELKLPRMSIEKFETGRQTPTQAQQKAMAAYFGVSLAYLKGDTDDRDDMTNWMDDVYREQSAPTAAPVRPRVHKPVAEANGSGENMFSAFLSSKKFQETLKAAALEALKSPEGQELLAKAIRKELGKNR